MSATSLSTLMEPAISAGRPICRGRVTSVRGLSVEVSGVDAAVGDVVMLDVDGQERAAEVISLGVEQVTCMPIGSLDGLRIGTPVRATGGPLRIAVGDGLLGRILDGLGRPIDGKGPVGGAGLVCVDNDTPDPLTRTRIQTQLGMGVRALDAFVPVGRGQRVGVFAGSGVGKSTLLSMIARGSQADVNVIALIGERGREVREFIENDLGPEGLARSVVIVATSDQPPVARLRAAFVATRIAEFFRDSGGDVLLLMDSITRTAYAQREIGLSAGEPPATRGYPPSVFAMLPRLLERAGASNRGTITALYTVLIDGDDLQDPIGDTTRSILDGHIVLDRSLAIAGHYPAIDVLGSVSRVVTAITNAEQRTCASHLRRLLAAHREAKVLIDIGAYVPGSDPVVDQARAVKPVLDALLTQDIEERTSPESTWAMVTDIAQQCGVRP
jgi:flagellum-specific ATP synthase